jgi:hypothetical protein
MKVRKGESPKVGKSERPEVLGVLFLRSANTDLHVFSLSQGLSKTTLRTVESVRAVISLSVTCSAIILPRRVCQRFKFTHKNRYVFLNQARESGPAKRWASRDHADKYAL